MFLLYFFTFVDGRRSVGRRVARYFHFDLVMIRQTIVSRSTKEEERGRRAAAADIDLLAPSLSCDALKHCEYEESTESTGGPHFSSKRPLTKDWIVFLDRLSLYVDAETK